MILLKNFYLKPKFFSVIKNYSAQQFTKDLIAGVIVAMKSPSIPCVATMPATIDANAAVGPAI